MATIYVLLASPLDSDQANAFTDSIFDNGGRLAVLVSPEIAIVDGDASTALALETLVGDGVVAVGSDDVTSLLSASSSSPELTALVNVLALTTPAAIALADAVRPFQGEAWPGLGCIFEEA
jgi:hypothetical protein